MAVNSTELPGAGWLRHCAVSPNKLLIISIKLRKNRENSENTSKIGLQAVPDKVDARVGDRRRPARFGKIGHEKSLKSYKKE
jgi:hypothetical protein